MAVKSKAPSSAGPDGSDQTIKAMVLPEIKTERLIIEIVGVTRLVSNKFSNKARWKMLQAQKGEKLPKEKRDPDGDFQRSLHKLAPDKKGRPRYGFPVTGVKEAMATAAARFFNQNKVAIYGTVYLIGEPSVPDTVHDPALPGITFSPEDCLEIVGDVTMRTDMVRNSGIGRTADIRFRGAFEKWHARLLIEFKKEFITAESLARLLEHAGSMVGLGEWRTEKGGDWGRFEVKKAGAVTEAA